MAYRDYNIEEGPIKVEDIRVYHGANYFSGGPIVLFRINLGSYDEVFTNEIEGFFEKLSELLPSLYEHHCSVGRVGGFFIRVKEGTLLGHVMEHVAIELQTLAGMDVGYGKTRSTLTQGVYNVIFRYLDEEAGIYAGKAALNLINAIVTGKPFDVFSVIEKLIGIREKNLFGPSTQAIVDECEKRQIPWIRLDNYNLVQLGTGKYLQSIRATMTSQTSYIAVDLASDKFLTTQMLREAGVPVPETIETDNADEAYRFFKKIGAPLVIKPVKGKLGEYSTVNIRLKKQMKAALQLTAASGEKALVQRFISGKVYRLLVINNKFVAAARLEPPSITGDGKATVGQLIKRLNNEEGRSWGDKDKLTRVETDETTQRILDAAGLSLNSILPAGKILYLKKSGNPKVGGYSTDVTSKVHFMNRFFAEYAAQTINLNIAGVDIICNDISKPIHQNGGAVIEINAAPDFRMHLKPARGEGRNVVAPLLDMLFPPGAPNHIPIFSVTGSSGKTLTTQLLNFCFRQAGFRTGLANSKGLYLNGKKIISGDATFPRFVSTILKNPNLDCAVVETSKEGILREGLGYQYAGFGIVLNVDAFDTGSDDIRYIEDLAYAMSVVAEQVEDDGFTILNADDANVLEMRERIYSQLALFSMHSAHPEVTAHTRRGGLAVYIESQNLIIHHFNKKNVVLSIDDIPAALRKTPQALQVVMAATAALHAFGFETVKIKTWIRSFKPERK